MERFLFIALAGGVGTGLRYLLGLWTVARFSDAFPWGTLAVNLIGSFLICLLARMLNPTEAGPSTLQLVLLTGFLGGFTTYSAFNLEVFRFLQAGQTATALGYVAATIVGGLSLGWFGWTLGEMLAR